VRQALAAGAAPLGPNDYGTSMWRSPALGPDGRLAEPDALGQASETPRDDGPYSGRAGSRSVSLRVSGGGRTVRAFSAQVAMLCPGSMPGQFTTQIGKAFLGRIRVAPDGTFIGAGSPDRRTAIRVTGRLRRGAASGRVALSVGPCVGNAKFSARRR
jgi:hypothetical protein